MHDSVYGCEWANGWSSWRTCAKIWFLWSLHVQVEREDESQFVTRLTRTRMGRIWGLGGRGYREMVWLVLENVEMKVDHVEAIGGGFLEAYGVEVRFWKVWVNLVKPVLERVSDPLIFGEIGFVFVVYTDRTLPIKRGRGCALRTCFFVCFGRSFGVTVLSCMLSVKLREFCMVFCGRLWGVFERHLVATD